MPSRADLEACRDRAVDDLAGECVCLLFVGINPSLWTAAVGAHFARPGNRFYPALYAAGITDRLLDAGAGLSPQDERHLVQRGVGITNLVNRATARADELGRDELVAGAAAVRGKAERWRPAVVALVGITAYRLAFRRRDARPGRQPEGLAGSALWVLPNPSGLNAHEDVASLARAYRAAALDAGIPLGPLRA